MAQASSFGGLPAETAQQIVGYLAKEEPCSVKNLPQEPSICLLESDQKPLKNLSLTFFSFLFQILRCSFSVLTAESTQGNNADECLKDLYALSRFVARYRLARKVRGLTFFFPVQTDIGGHYLHDFRFKLLAFALGEINPERLTIIAAAAVLGKIGQLHVDEHDTWAFGKKIHVLSLRQPREVAGPSASTRRISTGPGPCDCLYGLRPWTGTTINEGSCLAAYSTYEYYHKMTPSIIRGGGLPRPLFLEKQKLLPHVTNFEYVAICPLPNHMYDLSHLLRCLPSLVSLVTQFTPAGNAPRDILEDKEALGKANISDFWMESTQAYEMLAKDLMIWSGQGNFRQWRSTDDRIEFDEIVGPILVGWEMREPLVWERVDVAHDDR
ncbi:MAG: hypothetical protein LQ346_006443 [Caloplaca aetnensis]|nr:MAG: hypothetical protein LQ346_006443 [Caloplaca aetnensis]